MDTLTLWALWLTAVDAPLAPALEFLTGIGLAPLGLGVVAWVRFLLTPGSPAGARPGGEDASLFAWRPGRLGRGALSLAPVPGRPGADDVRRIAEAVARWDREAAVGVTTLVPGLRVEYAGWPTGAGRPRAPLTHRTPDA